MTLSPREFIALDRRFERASGTDSDEYWADILAERERPRDWAWLRERSRVVALLAQAGSGKTAEFLSQVDGVRAAGGDAFFFRVERLCSGSVEEALESDECRRRFDSWLGRSGAAEIFLDAVDEAKLPQARTARPLRDALQRLTTILRPHYHRISIFISCRSSEWFEDIEQKALQSLADEMGAATGSDTQVSVFNATFRSLNLRQISLLAESRGGKEAVEALSQSEAIKDIVTPLDAILLLEAYSEFRGTPELDRRLSLRGLVLEASIRRRLMERGGDVRRSQLDFGSGMKAARFLAFASIVAQTMDIAIGSPRKDTVDPVELLTAGHAALSPDAIRQFLACSLFVPSGQARVRFYRREARDMLAAQWLYERIEEGASAFAVTERFIKTVFGKPRVPSTYGGMLAWLASYDPVTRRRMTQAAPEWIIENGDPRSLALEDRVNALDQHFALGPHRMRGYFSFDVEELKRFARPELEKHIVAYLASPPPGDLFDQLMQLLTAGGYRSAAPHLVTLLKDFNRSAGDRMFAVRALIACGSSEDLGEVARHFASTGGPEIDDKEGFSKGRNDHFLLDLLKTTYPAAIGLGDALALCAQLNGKDYSHEAKDLAQWLVAAAPAEDLEGWFVGLDRLCFDTSASGSFRPFSYDMPPLHVRAKMLLRPLVEVAARYLTAGPITDSDRDLLIYDRVRHARDLGGGFAMSRQGCPIPGALTRNVLLRRALFEKLASVEKRNSTHTVFYQHIDWGVYRGGADREDLAWLLERYRETEGPDRLDYGQTATFIAAQIIRKRRAGPRLNIARYAMRQRPFDWKLAKRNIVDPLTWPLTSRLAQRKWRYRDPDAGLKRKASRAWDEIRFRFNVRRNMRAIRRGEAKNLLCAVIFEDSYEVPEPAELRKRLKRGIHAPVTTGARAYALSYRPVDRGRYINAEDNLALAGYRFHWDADPSMCGVDATAALRTALYFTTDWPAWAGALIRANPQAWADAAVPLLLKELASPRPAIANVCNRHLSTVAYLDEDLRGALAGSLFTAIQPLRVIDGSNVELVARILQSDPEAAKQLPGLAARHAREAWFEGSRERALQWMPYWAEGDIRGIDTLLSWVSEDPRAVPQALGIYVRVFGNREKGPPAPLEVRARFANLAFAHIRPCDDEPFREGPHSVTARDELEHLRGSVSELLSADFNAPERAALEQVITSHVTPVSPQWADNWRNRYEHSAAAPLAWSREAILDAGRDLAGAPSNGDQLLDKVGEMIRELEQELASSQFDQRGLFPPAIKETDFRAWLGDALDRRRRQWFSIVQEAETSRAKRTDLRIELRSANAAVVVIEIKLLHRWHHKQLIDKFKTQLVGQYLLEQRVRHGIYLIVDLGEKPQGRMPDGRILSSVEIANHLNEGARDAGALGGPIARAQVFKIACSLG